MPRVECTAIEIAAQRVTDNSVNFSIVAATQMLKGVHDFGRKAKRWWLLARHIA